MQGNQRMTGRFPAVVASWMVASLLNITGRSKCRKGVEKGKRLSLMFAMLFEVLVEPLEKCPLSEGCVCV